MKTVTVTLPSPVSANVYWRTRVVKNMAMTYVSKEAKDFKAQVLQLLRAAGVDEPFPGRVAVSLQLYPHQPLDWQTRQRKLGANWDDGVRSIDLDNSIKVTLDALKGVVIDDDKWIRRLTAERMEPDGEARVVVTITAMAVTQPQASLLGEAA